MSPSFRIALAGIIMFIIGVSLMYSAPNKAAPELVECPPGLHPISINKVRGCIKDRRWELHE